MPIEYVQRRVKCKFRCGYNKRAERLQLVVRHEARCLKNPEREDDGREDVGRVPELPGESAARQARREQDETAGETKV